jgi:predicted nucleotidyltransferase
MKDVIISKLKEIEEKEKIRIILAVESGSRAWGFASTDSDYDVRFIYIRPKDEYLRLEKRRDVIEYPINDELDINGWDLDKTLKLLHDSNPTLFEWFNSPIVYKETEEASEIRKLFNDHFSVKKSLHLYLSMSTTNYREFIRDHELVKAKKYFYVLRPLLAARYVLRTRQIPPIEFGKLRKEELPHELDDVIDDLLDIKINNPEIKMIRPIIKLNEYLEKEHVTLQLIAEGIEDDRNKNWTDLNHLFRKLLERR